MDYYNFFKERHLRELDRRDTAWSVYRMLISYKIILASMMLYLAGRIDDATTYPSVYIGLLSFSLLFYLVSVLFIIKSLKGNTLRNFAKSDDWLRHYDNLTKHYGANTTQRDEKFELDVIKEYSNNATINKRINDSKGWDLRWSMYGDSASTILCIITYFIP